MTIDKKQEGDTVYLRIDGGIDSEGGVKLSETFARIIEDDSIHNAEFDLREVTSITSAGIGKMLKFYKHIEKKGGQMKINGISAPLKTQFEEIHLNHIIPIV